MFIKLRPTVWLAMAVIASLSVPVMSVRAEETIDTFARAHLKSSQEAADSSNGTNGTNGAGSSSAKGAKSEVPPELLFIHGVDDTTVAYLRVDGRFGYSVSDGDRFGDWQVVKIGSDFVDVARGGKPSRLLLPNAMGPVQANSARLGASGRRNGEDF
ncbi:hypothetical protein [Pandoraea sp.]|uniref:hypothetical protein n=1 Tax=Pandoraea sp. TaxID=1883445 RepID=UPI0035B47A43